MPYEKGKSLARELKKQGKSLEDNIDRSTASLVCGVNRQEKRTAASQRMLVALCKRQGVPVQPGDDIVETAASGAMAMTRCRLLRLQVLRFLVRSRGLLRLQMLRFLVRPRGLLRLQVLRFLVRLKGLRAVIE